MRMRMRCTRRHAYFYITMRMRVDIFVIKPLQHWEICKPLSTIRTSTRWLRYSYVVKHIVTYSRRVILFSRGQWHPSDNKHRLLVRNDIFENAVIVRSNWPPTHHNGYPVGTVIPPSACPPAGRLRTSDLIINYCY